MIDRPPDFDERVLGRDPEFLPIGLDGQAWAYRVGREFVKVRRGEFAPAAYLLPPYLREQGLTEVVAPTGPPVPAGDGYWALRYPFHEGTSLWSRGLTDAQWIHYGQFLGRLHAIPFAEPFLPGETYTTTAPARFHEYAAALPERFRGRVAALCSKVEELAARLTPRPHVICHADIHPGNLIADGDGPLHVVDWDAPILAPRERDLMFVFSGDFGDHPLDERREALFRKGYGPLELDGELMAYYRDERRLDDIAEFLRAKDMYWLTRIAESLSV